MKIIGLTGGSGGGKSVVASVFARLGAYIIDADVVYHGLLESSREMIDEIGRQFANVLTPEGKIDRRHLANIVFADSSMLNDLTSITYRHILSAIDKELSDLPDSSVAVIDAIGLIESKLYCRCDTVIAVTAPREVRAARLMERDGADAVYINKRLDAQQPDSFFEKYSRYVVKNTGDTAALEVQAVKIWSEIINS